jgi:transcription initiation factor TFIIH subunit 4
MVPHRGRFHVIHFEIQDYSTENLSQTQKAMLEDLRDYGLVWQRDVVILSEIRITNAQCHSYRQPSSQRFSPTRLATTLTSSSPPLPTSTGTGSGPQAQGFIVLETNYRIYAYTGLYTSSCCRTRTYTTTVR